MSRIIRVFLVCCLIGCGGADQRSPEVVVYVALDELYSAPILEAFTERTGIPVRALYDTEASKTTGLVTRLLAEADRPRADVFWNNEVAQTIVLKEKGTLAAYNSPSAQAMPDAFRDAEHYWTGFAARARVIIYNAEQVSDPPLSIRDFASPEWRGKAAIALPLFGTTATHAGALFAHLGPEQAKDFLQSLLDNDVAILSGNATVRDAVARGEYAVGLTDTDDANGAIEDGLPAKWLFPDQEPDGMGTLLIPNTVALVKGAPHLESARTLIDYLLSPEVEAKLAAMRSIQIPLNPAVDSPANVPDGATIQTMPVSFEAIATQMEPAARYVREAFVQK